MSKTEFKKVYNIWNRECSVDVIFECYKGDDIDEYQTKSFEDFECNIEKYTQIAYKVFEDYCIERYSDKLGIDRFDNIFKYIVPKTVFFEKYAQEKGSFCIACYFKFDKDGGIAVKFYKGQVLQVGSEMIM